MKLDSKTVVETVSHIGLEPAKDGEIRLVVCKGGETARRSWSIGAGGLGRIIMVLRGMSESETIWSGPDSNVVIEHRIDRRNGYVFRHSIIGDLVFVDMASAIVLMEGASALCLRLVEE